MPWEEIFKMEERTIVLKDGVKFQIDRAYVTDVIFDKGCDGKTHETTQ